MFLSGIKKPISVAGDGCEQSIFPIGNPAIRAGGPVGFASPDYSGFAFFQDSVELCNHTGTARWFLSICFSLRTREKVGFFPACGTLIPKIRVFNNRGKLPCSRPLSLLAQGFFLPAGTVLPYATASASMFSPGATRIVFWSTNHGFADSFL
jgi:hypothetical protein